jgi:hypothetical protein
MSLKNEVILITSAASDIGLSTAHHLATNSICASLQQPGAQVLACIKADHDNSKALDDVVHPQTPQFSTDLLGRIFGFPYPPFYERHSMKMHRKPTPIYIEGYQHGELLFTNCN